MELKKFYIAPEADVIDFRAAERISLDDFGDPDDSIPGEGYGDENEEE